MLPVALGSGAITVTMGVGVADGAGPGPEGRVGVAVAAGGSSVLVGVIDGLAPTVGRVAAVVGGSVEVAAGGCVAD
jgi:hypothetical protein